MCIAALRRRLALIIAPGLRPAPPAPEPLKTSFFDIAEQARRRKEHLAWIESERRAAQRHIRARAGVANPKEVD